MPYTKRKAIHKGEKGLGLHNSLGYAMNDKKTDHGILSTGYNCTASFAEQEFEAIQRKFHKEDDERVAYHVIQSFDPRDTITPSQANEIGIKLCKEIYGEFQCVVSTHVDRGHIHNHIIINATSLSGRKLEDRLANKKEGLYGLREASDRIGKEYGCHLMKEFKPIGVKHKNKDYTYIDQYHQKKNIELTESKEVKTNWKRIIVNTIEKLKEEVNSFDELMERLALEGYEIKRGKYVSIKPLGKTRFVRMYNLSEDKKIYSEEGLRKFFYQKRKGEFLFRTYKGDTETYNKYVHDLSEVAEKSKQAIELSSLGLSGNENYPKFYNSRYLEVKRYNEVIASMELLNEENIHSYDDLLKSIASIEDEVHYEESEYEKMKSLINIYNDQKQFAYVYLETYNAYLRYQEILNKVGAELTVTNEDVERFLNAKEQLNNADIMEVRELLSEIDKEKREANKKYAYITYLKSKLTDLERLKAKSLELQGYIKGLSFSKNMIDYERSTKHVYCVKIPYNDLYIYLKRDSMAWDSYEKHATIYLIDDQEYDLYDKDNNIIDSVSGDQLESIAQNGRQAVKEYYASLEERIE